MTANANNKVSARQAAIDALAEHGEPMKLNDLVTETLKRAKGLKTGNAGDIVRVQVIRQHLDGGAIKRVGKGTYTIRPDAERKARPERKPTTKPKAKAAAKKATTGRRQTSRRKATAK